MCWIASIRIDLSDTLKLRQSCDFHEHPDLQTPASPTKAIRASLSGDYAHDLSTRVSDTGKGLHLHGAVEETADLLLDGEVDPSMVPKDTLPVRYLDGFIIKDMDTGKMISLDEIESEESSSSPYFVGWVTPKLENPISTEEYVELQRVLIRSSAIFSIWQSREPENNRMVYEERYGSLKCLYRCLPPISAIWIWTQFSWYILEKPDPSYRHLFVRTYVTNGRFDLTYISQWQPYLRHALFLSIVHQSLNYKDQTLHKFFKVVRWNELKWAKEDLGEPLMTEEDVKEVVSALQIIFGEGLDIIQASRRSIRGVSIGANEHI